MDKLTGGHAWTVRHGRTYGHTDGRMNARMNGHTDGRIEAGINGHRDGCSNSERTHGQMDTDGRLHGCMDIRLPIEPIDGPGHRTWLLCPDLLLFWY